MKRIAVVVAILLMGCALSNVQSPTELSPKARLALVMGLYNNAWDNYQAQYAATPAPMSKDMVEYFKAYKAALVAVEPVIKIYDGVVSSGGVPTPEQEQAIISIIYQLQAMLMRKGG